MMAKGSWWFRSKSDPRWNVNGRGIVGMFMDWTAIPEAEKAYFRLDKKYGDPPKDLEFGYMKD